MLKKASKTYKGTLNDMVLSILSCSIKEYLLKKGDSNNTINLLLPFSLREIPNSMAEHKLENDFSTLCFTLNLHNKFNEAFQQISAVTKKMKYSIHPYGFNTITQATGIMPGLIGQLVIMWVVSKATIAFSNVPGPKTEMVFGQTKCKGIIGLIPGLGDMAFGISAIS